MVAASLKRSIRSPAHQNQASMASTTNVACIHENDNNVCSHYMTFHDVSGAVLRGLSKWRRWKTTKWLKATHTNFSGYHVVPIDLCSVSYFSPTYVMSSGSCFQCPPFIQKQNVQS